MGKKCLNCEALLVFDKEKEIYRCEYCRAEFTLEQIESIEEQLENFDYLIPFKVDQKEALKIISNVYNKKIFKPSKFNLKSCKKNIKGIYIPAWIFDYDAVGTVEFECNKVSNWKSEGYKYIKTDKYKVLRSGKTKFNNVLVNNSKKVSNELLENIGPFNYDELTKVDSNYVLNKKVATSIMSKDESIIKANNLSKSLFINQIKEDIKQYKKITEIDSMINLQNTNASHILLPIWLLSVKYKKNNYLIAINGQTGKLRESIPIDKKRIVFVFLLTFLFVFVVLLGINILKVMS